jgi:hypothetical protein
MSAKRLIWTATPWLVELVNPPRCWNPLPTPSKNMSSRDRPSSPMTRRSRCWLRVPVKPGPHGFGPMFATNGPGPERRIPAAWYQFSLDRKGVRLREHLLDYEGFKKCMREFLRIKGLSSECRNDFFNFNGVQSSITPRPFVEPSS